MGIFSTDRFRVRCPEPNSRHLRRAQQHRPLSYVTYTLNPVSNTDRICQCVLLRRNNPTNDITPQSGQTSTSQWLRTSTYVHFTRYETLEPSQVDSPADLSAFMQETDIDWA
jgi:hypothetical protein